jgi:hypothetical protein
VRHDEFGAYKEVGGAANNKKTTKKHSQMAAKVSSTQSQTMIIDTMTCLITDKKQTKIQRKKWQSQYSSRFRGFLTRKKTGKKIKEGDCIGSVWNLDKGASGK